MAVVSRISRVRITTALGAFREWTATAAVQDTAAGASVAVTVAQITSGAIPPDSVNQPIELNFYIDNGATLIRSISITPGTLPSIQTFFFTQTGLSGAAIRNGTVRMRLRVEKTNGGPLATYHVDSDGTNNTPISGGSSQTDQGWIMGTGTATIAVSNVMAGGSKVEPAQVLEDVFHRATVNSDCYSSYQTTHSFTGTSKSKNSGSSAAAVRDVTFSGTSIAEGRVNEGFPAADATYTAAVAVATNSALTGQPITKFTSVTADTLRVDPRRTMVWVLYLNMPSFGAPPYSDHEASGERPSSDYGRVGAAIYGARGTFDGVTLVGGINGININISGSPDSDPSVSLGPSNFTTATQGGEPGWAGFLDWTNPLPGGDWTFQAAVTGPSDITSSSYLIGNEVVYQLIASRNPFVVLVSEAGHAIGANTDRHMHNGDPFEVNCYFKRTKEGARGLLEADESPKPAVSFERIRDGVVQRLIANGTTMQYEWESAETEGANGDPAGALVFFEMTKVSTYYWTFAVPTNESWSDVIANIAGQFQGVQYDAVATREFVGRAFQHDQDQTRAIGVEQSVYKSGGTDRLQDHLRSSGMDLELLVVPQNQAGPDNTVDRIRIALRRIRNGLSSQDLLDLDEGPWIDTNDAGHPNSGELVFSELNLLPSGAAIVRIPESVLDLASATVPWIVAKVEVTYSLGQPDENVQIKPVTIFVYPTINLHHRYQIDPAGILGFPTR